MSNTNDQPKLAKQYTASRFFDPVITALGKLSDFTARKHVKMEAVMDAVIEAEGIKEKDIRALGQELQDELRADHLKALVKRKKLDENDADAVQEATKSFDDAYDALVAGTRYIHRRIGFAFRNRRAKSKTGKTAYCAKDKALTFQAKSKKGEWALSNAGVEKAQVLTGKAPVPTNDAADPVADPAPSAKPPAQSATARPAVFKVRNPTPKDDEDDDTVPSVVQEGVVKRKIRTLSGVTNPSS